MGEGVAKGVTKQLGRVEMKEASCCTALKPVGDEKDVDEGWKLGAGVEVERTGTFVVCVHARMVMYTAGGEHDAFPAGARDIYIFDPALA